MEQNRICENCSVEVSSDLSNCPLCGKHINDNNLKCEVNKKSYPIYDLKFVTTARWYNIIRAIFWIIGIVSTVVNLKYRTDVYWFPYALAGLIMIFHVFIEPIKTNVKSYIKSLTIMSVLLSIFVIFIDAYNHYSFKIQFGWAVSYAAPLIMLAGVVASGIICLSSKIYEADLIRRITFLALFSILYFVVKTFCFETLVDWPSLTFMCTSVSLVVLLEIFKRNKLVKELAREFHI